MQFIWAGKLKPPYTGPEYSFLFRCTCGSLIPVACKRPTEGYVYTVITASCFNPLCTIERTFYVADVYMAMDRLAVAIREQGQGVT